MITFLLPLTNANQPSFDFIIHLDVALLGYLGGCYQPFLLLSHPTALSEVRQLEVHFLRVLRFSIPHESNDGSESNNYYSYDYDGHLAIIVLFLLPVYGGELNKLGVVMIGETLRIDLNINSASNIKLRRQLALFKVYYRLMVGSPQLHLVLETK